MGILSSLTEKREESIGSNFTLALEDRTASGGRIESRAEGRSGSLGASVIFTAGMVILVANT